ncbi:MAG: sugar-transfer associated ATP-grasp domain-containing protein [Pseudomonadota bacterium]|nr:sugar-transfer associated ATP-grasp domain-containing protein [Pseudomonadota bacterium]
MHSAEFAYYAKKAFALFPGGADATSAPVFAAHYARRRRNRSLAREALDRVIARAFFAWLPSRTRAVARKYGMDAQWERQALAIARARFVDPNDIALFRIERAEELDHYIRRFEDAGFNKIINQKGWSRACALVDKAAFYRRCAAHDLPHPAVHAVYDREVHDFRPAHGHPLIAKPTHGEGGRGVALLPHAVSDITDQAAFAQAIAPYVDDRQVWVLQRALRNHAALTDYAMDALATARLTTMRNETGEPELVSSVLRVPSLRGPVIDNMKAGGLIMPVDLETGRADIACKGYGGGDYHCHPVSCAAFSDLQLPDWKAAVALACRAHSTAFPEYTLIGWDIGFTPDGPMVVEGNAKPGVLMPQRSGRKGLAGQRYGELLAFNLERAEREQTDEPAR